MITVTSEFIRFENLLQNARSIRRFRQDIRVERKTLERLVSLTRYTPSGRNLQPLRYRLVDDPAECEAVFQHLKWAGYLTDWDGPCEGERPTAYLIQCLDTDLTNNLLCDDGVELEALVLGARTLGLGACIIKSFNVKAVQEILRIEDKLALRYVLALGVPAESSEIEDIPAGCDDIRYRRDENGMMHVPKRSLDERLI